MNKAAALATVATVFWATFSWAQEGAPSLPGDSTSAETSSSPEAVSESAIPPGRETLFMKAWNPIRDAGIHGYASFDYFSSDKALNDRRHFPGLNLVIRSEPYYGDYFKLFGEARILAQDLNHPRPGESGASHFDSRTQTLYEEVQLELREGYLQIFGDSFEFRAGKQIIVWGRADEINPTDWLSARNYTLLLPEPYDQRFGVFGAKLDVDLPGDLRLSGVWQPIPTASIIPLPVVPDLSFQRVLPEVKLENGEAGVKIDRTGGGVEWSLSYFTGFNRLPEVSLVPPSGSPPFTLRLSHHRVHGVGGDFVYIWRTWGLRGEASYVHTKNPDGESREIQTPFVSYVLGVEKDFGNSMNLIAQYYGRYIFNRYETDALPPTMGPPPDPTAFNDLIDQVALYNALFTNQLDTVQNGVSIRFDKKWWNDTLDLDIVYAVNFERTNWMLRPKLTYGLTDEWKATLGGEVYKGENISQFGFLEDNTTVFTEMRWSY